ncbi:NAD(P)/FAD-dependent oxidoreductase [Halorubrum cibi]|uniref:Glycine/D-amino acid oxidase n=1 Tax=Halorubrum cibi TaxID=413815 RepID=A0A521D8P5_9EURY|nr:FAD-dependent oxidoreductase [Halorubrum cibi]SMO68064.1 Glycine/D-amino acid oxidase [Halorubrum cibi]
MADSNPSNGVEPSDATETTSASVAVVGGGAVGVTAAHDLAERGATVTLFERDDLASGASGRAAGVLYDAYAEDVDAAVGARAMERFRAFDRTLPGFDFSPCPYVIAVREGDEDAEAVPGMVDRMREHGRDVSLLEPAELGERFPLSTDDLAVAAVGEGAGWADPGSYVVALGERAAREGVTVETDAAVELVAGAGATVRVDGEERAYDAVVVAVGAHTERFLEGGGIAVPVKPYRVQALTSRVAYGGPMTYDATAGVYFRPHPTGLLAGDGTEPFEADPDAYDREGDDWFVESVSGTLRERADHDPEVERAWAGVCTATPDGDPLLGPVAEDIFVAAGWQGHGFMRAPATGEILAEGTLASLSGAAVDDPDSPWIEAFDPNRFEGDETFEIEEGMSVSNR